MRALQALLLLLLACAVPAAAGTAQVERFRLSTEQARTRLVFDLSAPVEHRVFTLSSPHRVVVDLKAATLAAGLEPPQPQAGSVLSGIRSAPRPSGGLRVVLDLKSAVRPKSFSLKPNGHYGHRLVLDLSAGGAQASAAARRPAPQLRDVVIAIDAGHGGVDPGAQGGHGTKEKDVVLAIARELEKLVAAERGMRPVMVRDGDYYLRLRKRISIARRHKADLFVSIHADAFRDSRVRGSSVYALSQNGATSEAARWLAERENAADLIGGVSLDDKDELLASVLLDLSQTATIEASLGVGERVLDRLKGLGKVHKSRVQQAGFAVLKSPDIPSILVETAFISNPYEETRLRKGAHQKAMARAIVEGMRDYFDEYAPPGTLLAARRHVIARGETLSEIASRYEVSTRSLRMANRLQDDRLRAGEVLRIPAEQGS